MNGTLKNGDVVGEYCIESVLSKSDVSITYKASGQDSSLYIIKEYYPDSIVERNESGELVLTDDTHEELFCAEKKRFQETGHVISEFHHSNIADVINTISEKNTEYMVINYEEAFTLKEILNQTPVLDEDDIKNIIFPILDGLKQLHNKDILHLSISTENILIRKNGSPLLIGFGSFYLRNMNNEKALKISNEEYAPIEQFTKKSELTGKWSDIYALGAVLYQCITGKAPPVSTERFASIEKMGVDNMEKVSEIRTEKYSSNILNAVDHALALNPGERPATVSDWTQEFIELGFENNIDSKDTESIPANENFVEKKSSLVDDELVDHKESKLKLYKAYLGGNRQTYYVASFIRQDDWRLIPRVSLNIGALIGSIFWILYRKMFLFSILIFPILFTLISYTTYMVVKNNISYEEYYLINPVIDTTIITSIVFFSFVAGLFGDYFYYLHVLLKIKRANKKFVDVNSQRKWLSETGGISNVAPIVGIIFISAVSVWGYEKLNIRNETSKIQMNEAIYVLNDTKNRVYLYKSENEKWPDNRDEIIDQHALANYQYIGDISILRQLIVVTFKENEVVIPDFAGKSIAIFGSDNSSGEVEWLCGSINISLEYLPTSCKRHLK